MNVKNFLSDDSSILTIVGVVWGVLFFGTYIFFELDINWHTMVQCFIGLFFTFIIAKILCNSMLAQIEQSEESKEEF